MWEVYENERYNPLKAPRWGSSYPGHLLPSDRKRWSRANGSCSTTRATPGTGDPEPPNSAPQVTNPRSVDAISY